jgi:hypothetical protein
MYELLAERAIGEPCVNYESTWMNRGGEMEREAVKFYEMERGVDTKTVGFVTSNDGRVGCSPDRLVGEDGLLEIKCPSAQKHVGYLLDNPADDYRIQIQGQLYICEREWCDLLSYNPMMPEAIVRIKPDEAFQDIFEKMLYGDPDKPKDVGFLNRLDALWEELQERGVEEFVDEGVKEIEEIFPDN